MSRPGAVRIFILLGLLALLLTACRGRSPNGPPVAAVPSPAVDVHRFSAPTQIGTGFIDGASPDGSALYVESPDPAFPQPGCEGQPDPALFRLPVDGQPRKLLDAQFQPLHGSLIRGGRKSAVALVEGCEGYFSRLLIGTEGREGRLVGLREVKPAVADGDNINAGSFSWSSDGRSLLAVVDTLATVDKPEDTQSRVVSIDPATGATVTLFTTERGSGAFLVGQLQNGTYVVASMDAVSLRDASGKIKASFPGRRFELAPDLRAVAVYGLTLSVVSQSNTSAALLVQQRPGWEISSASFSPDGKAIAFDGYNLEGGSSKTELSVVTVADKKVSLVAGGSEDGRPYFTGDGRALAFNRFTPEPDFTALVMLVKFTG